MKDVVIPTVGESITEATVGRWIKSDGEFVNRGEPILEVETDKANVEVIAENSGVLSIKSKEGEVVQIGATVAQIDESKSAPASSVASTSGKIESAGASTPVAPATTASVASASVEGGLSPAVRKIVAEKNLNPNEIQGSGKGGRLLKSDVMNVSTTPTPAPVAKPTPNENVIVPIKRSSSSQQGVQERVKMTTIRRRIAERLVQSQQSTATLTTFNDVDMTNILVLREKYKDSFKEKYGVSLGFMGFFVKASVEALKAFPKVNAYIDGTDIIYNHYYNIGIAVGTERGLIVPVVRDVDQMSLAEIELQIKDYAQKARTGKIAVDDLSGGTFTVSNGGVYGSMMSTPILNPPQSGILGMHRIEQRPVAIDGKVEIRPMMYLALSYDHRIIDGTESVQFLVKIKQCLEDPNRILLEI